ncbi:MAG: NYN domain-containing protein [Candidatus Brocadiia bacterium]
MSEKKTRIAIFVDYDDVCMALKGEDQNFPRPADILRPLTEAFLQQGDLVFRAVFADWAKYPVDTVELAQGLGYMPVYSLTRSRSRKTSVETNIPNAVPIRLALEALSLCLTNATIEKFIFVSADREFYELVDLLRQNDAGVVVAMFERAISVEVTEISGCEIVFLENILGQPRNIGPAAEKKTDWTAFVRLLLSLELRYGYVGYRGLKDKLDSSVGCGPSETDKRRFMDLATQQEIITLDKMENPKNPEFPLTVTRLNRKHPMVQAILKNSLKLE